MKLPRRVPWSSLAEVDEVCSWIYADENDIDTKIRAIQRLSAWKAITPLPHALESTLAILSVVVEDNSPSTSSRSSLFLRQAYSATLIRLVNGLVDPLQLGAYARSIASIAAQLGLPAWLVELRHAATHEELPSIEVLREGARQSMSWLLHNYFLPILNPSTADQSTSTLHPVQPLLKQYKSLLKITTRDASVALRFQGQITIVLRNIERWLGEAKLAARASSGDVSWDMSRSDQTDPDDSVDYTEKWALESLCDNLLEKGFLVPLSKKKRLLPKDKFEPPASSVALWTPLLNYLQPLHPALPSVLVSRIIDILLRGELADSTDTDAIIPDASYLAMLARWAAWLIERHGNDGEDGSATLREDALVSLAKGFLVQGDVSSNRKAATVLLEHLLNADHRLSEAVKPLMALTRVQSDLSSEWTSTDVATMQSRLNVLLAVTDASRLSGDIVADEGSSAQDAASLEATGADAHMATDVDQRLPPGWRRLDARQGWRASPIGVFVVASG